MADYRRFFSSDYASARARFRDEALCAGLELAAYPIGERGPDGTELTIDVARSALKAPRALVVSSGLHGIEGYFGSAVQRAWLASGREKSADVRIVLVHALNPYGFAWRRRVNERNVDLNRNFLLADQRYEGAHDGYRELHPLLNPESAPRRFEPFLLRTLPPLIKHGFRTLKNATAQGQYDYPKGLFFGGQAETTTQRILREQLPGWLGNVERVVHIDLHSGRGKFARYALCADMPIESARFVHLQKAYGKRYVEGFDPHGVLYEIRGGLGRWLEALLPRVHYDCLLAEFGTYNALEVLAVMRAENRAHHYGREQPLLVEQTKRALLEAFCPRASRWRRSVVSSALRVLDQALIDLRG